MGPDGRRSPGAEGIPGADPVILAINWPRHAAPGRCTPGWSARSARDRLAVPSPPPSAPGGTGFFEVVVLGFAFALVVVGAGLVVATTEGATAGAGCVVEVSIGGATGGDAGADWSHPARAKAATATVAKSSLFMPGPQSRRGTGVVDHDAAVDVDDEAVENAELRMHHRRARPPTWKQIRADIRIPRRGAPPVVRLLRGRPTADAARPIVDCLLPHCVAGNCVDGHLKLLFTSGRLLRSVILRYLLERAPPGAFESPRGTRR